MVGTVRAGGGRTAAVHPMPIKMFVITLSDALERQQQAETQLRAAGFDFRFFPAVRGTDAIGSSACPVDERDFLLATGRHVTAGEVGCYASHRLLWKHCASVGEPLLVMEDDFLLSDGFAAAVRHLEREIADFHFIRLQSERRARKRKVKSLGSFDLWQYTKAPQSAMCYGISPSAAQRLLTHADIIEAPVDVYMKRCWQHGQRMYGITPYTVTESPLSSHSQIAGRTKARKGFMTQLQRLFTRMQSHVLRTHYNYALLRRDRN